jgi:hypothetical protein
MKGTSTELRLVGRKEMIGKVEVIEYSIREVGWDNGKMVLLFDGDFEINARKLSERLFLRKDKDESYVFSQLKMTIDCQMAYLKRLQEALTKPPVYWIDGVLVETTLSDLERKAVFGEPTHYPYVAHPL